MVSRLHSYFLYCRRVINHLDLANNKVSFPRFRIHLSSSASSLSSSNFLQSFGLLLKFTSFKPGLVRFVEHYIFRLKLFYYTLRLNFSRFYTRLLLDLMLTFVTVCVERRFGSCVSVTDDERVLVVSDLTCLPNFGYEQNQSSTFHMHFVGDLRLLSLFCLR